MPSAYVIPGAGEPTREEFEERVTVFAGKLGEDWSLRPIWWSERGRHLGQIRKGLLSTYPARASIEREPKPTKQSTGTGSEFLRPVPWMIWKGRKLLLDSFAGVIADALLYWGQREAIQQKVLSQLPQESGVDPVPEIDVIAHSMGGIVAADLAAERRLRIRTLVTFGTPVSAAYVLDAGRFGPHPFDPGQPITLSHIGAWTNLWNAYDQVALLAAGVFVTGRGAPRDIRVVAGEFASDLHSANAHLAYWELDEVHEAVREAFRPGGATGVLGPNAT